MYISRNPVTFTDEEICTIYRELRDRRDDYVQVLKEAVNDDMFQTRKGYLDDLDSVLNKITDNGEFYPF